MANGLTIIVSGEWRGEEVLRHMDIGVYVGGGGGGGGGNIGEWRHLRGRQINACTLYTTGKQTDRHADRQTDKHISYDM